MRSLSVLLTALVAASACTGESPPEPAARSSFAEDACGLPREHLQRIRRGYFPGRSGEIQLVPHADVQMDDYRPHAGPWSYVQDIPLVFRGPVARGARSDRPATLADVAPTVARHLDIGLPGAEGRVLASAGPPGAAPPRLVLTVVLDAVGRNVLEAHPRAWPNLRRLAAEGVWYERATVGSSPSLTGSAHATLGTGTFPRRHGRVDHWLRFEGRIAQSKDLAVADLRVPTLAERWDEANGNRPLVGMVAERLWHLGMIGRGLDREGGDADLAVAEPKEGWHLPGRAADLYRTPAYARRVTPSPGAIRALDVEDGVADEAWRGDGELLERFALTLRTTEIALALIEREGFGRDQLTDLLFLNYKEADGLAHFWSLDGPEMRRTLRLIDAELGRLTDALDRALGRDRWLLVVTADHGAAPVPERAGHFVVRPEELRRDLERELDPTDEGRLIEVVRPTQLWVDEEVLARTGRSLDEVAREAASYTRAENAKDPEGLPEAEGERRVFAAAFPGDVLEGLACG